MEGLFTAVTAVSVAIGAAVIAIGGCLSVGGLLMMVGLLLMVTQGGGKLLASVKRRTGGEGQAETRRTPVRQRREPVYLRHQKKNTRRTR